MSRAVLLLFAATFSLYGGVTYRVKLTAAEGGAVVTLPAEQYVAAVVAGETGSFTNPEALKAMAVAARTYAAHFRSRHQTEGYDFCSTTHCQRVSLRDAIGRFKEAAQSTHGQLLWFESRPAMSVYTKNCGGTTESASALWPAEKHRYLVAHPDPYCTSAEGRAWAWQVDAAQLIDVLQRAGITVPDHLQSVVVTEQTQSHRARTLLLVGSTGSIQVSAGTFRFAVGRTLGWNTIRSDRYRIQTFGTRIRFEGFGQGHGIGLCQDGADEMAAAGKTYKEILAFYYPGATVSVLANDQQWITEQSDKITVFATRRNIARDVNALSAALLAEWAPACNLPQPDHLVIYVYPDLESYRNSTGEPGWIAAHTLGNKIELQPIDTLTQHGGVRSVLRHELLHSIIDTNATPTLPAWFREGLTELLAGDTPHLADTSANPVDVTNRTDARKARSAYDQAKARVDTLRARYGMAELLRWVRNGIPEAAMRSVPSRSAANNR